ncbi:unnamed protein product [Rangifer tarandus platyrhynchus]|uniref:Uncharacterized protein n=1 Tax=Rangifer tarandus platyrhynchus TaxID=3082113 RepID=A0ACB1KHC9_RANTA
MPDSTWRRALRPLHPGVSSGAGTVDRGETPLHKRGRLPKPTERASDIQDLPQYIEPTVPWWLTKRISLQCRRPGFSSLGREGPPEAGHGNPLQYSCLENPLDRGAWRATVHGVTKSQTRLSR